MLMKEKMSQEAEENKGKISVSIRYIVPFMGEKYCGEWIKKASK